MPIYEYKCPQCDTNFEKMRSFSQSDAESPCPSCGTGGKKLVSVFASFSKGSDGSSAPIGGGVPSCGSCAATSCSTCG
ncbi:MAG: zinc ribbon domain-containing protein [Dehalococcoidia bacterium]|nr:zinc ribbon domain-containing protein [Dehalococcoidia bacterium]